MKLLEVNQIHFSIWSAEVNGQLASDETRRKYQAKAFEIADILREFDDIEGLDEIIEVLFGLGFNSEESRHQAFEAVTKKNTGVSCTPNTSRRSKKSTNAIVS